jgi:hypothetical protein
VHYHGSRMLSFGKKKKKRKIFNVSVCYIYFWNFMNSLRSRIGHGNLSWYELWLTTVWSIYVQSSHYIIQVLRYVFKTITFLLQFYNWRFTTFYETIFMIKKCVRVCSMFFICSSMRVHYIILTVTVFIVYIHNIILLQTNELRLCLRFSDDRSWIHCQQLSWR